MKLADGTHAPAFSFGNDVSSASIEEAVGEAWRRAKNATEEDDEINNPSRINLGDKRHAIVQGIEVMRTKATPVRFSVAVTNVEPSRHAHGAHAGHTNTRTHIHNPRPLSLPLCRSLFQHGIAASKEGIHDLVNQETWRKPTFKTINPLKKRSHEVPTPASVRKLATGDPKEVRMHACMHARTCISDKESEFVY
jgi:hypothetical protein